jgi:hypothetical protein
MKLNIKSFLKFSKKHFFLNYLRKKGMLNVKEDNAETQPLDLKELLNENKIRVTLSDIFIDWLNYRRSYYFIKLVPEEVPETKIPFEKKDMNIKNFIGQIFADVRFKRYWKYFLYAVIIVAYIDYRVDGADKRNIEYLKSLANSSTPESNVERDKYKNFKF